MSAAIMQARGERTRLQNDVTVFVNTISEHMQLRPPCADALPQDSEVLRWKERYDELEQLRVAARKRVNETKDSPDLLEAVPLDKVITQLKYAEANLLRKLNGEIAGWQGGLSRVV